MHAFIYVLMYIFSASYLALDNQLVRSPLGKTPSPTLTFPQLPIVPCVRLRSRGLFPVHFGMSSGVVLVQLRIGQELMSVSSDVTWHILNCNFGYFPFLC